MTADAARKIFGYDSATADAEARNAHEIAFTLSHAALASMDVVDAVLLDALRPMFEKVGADPAHVTLTLVAERLCGFIRTLAKNSPHPLAAALRAHGDLPAAEAAGGVAILERLMRDGVL